jgi:hypothetical protein
MNMTDTKKDILEWVKERLASVPDDAEMTVRVELAYYDEENARMVEV